MSYTMQGEGVRVFAAAGNRFEQRPLLRWLWQGLSLPLIFLIYLGIFLGTVFCFVLPFQILIRLGLQEFLKFRLGLILITGVLVLLLVTLLAGYRQLKGGSINIDLMTFVAGLSVAVWYIVRNLG